MNIIKIKPEAGGTEQEGLTLLGAGVTDGGQNSK